MRLRLLEPLKEFFKDEVRVLGKSLNLLDKHKKQTSFSWPWISNKNNR